MQLRFVTFSLLDIRYSRIVTGFCIRFLHVILVSLWAQNLLYISTREHARDFIRVDQTCIFTWYRELPSSVHLPDRENRRISSL